MNHSTQKTVSTYKACRASIEFQNIKLSGVYQGWTQLVHHEKSGIAAAIFQDKLNSELNLTNVPLAVAKRPFTLPTKIKPFRRWVLSKQRGASNGQKIRLDADLSAEQLINGNPARISRTDYFSSLCTNELGLTEIRESIGFGSCRDDAKSLFDGRSLWLTGEPDWQIKPLDSSDCSNHIGVSTLAISSKGIIPLIRQPSKSAQSSGLLAPSGSGSLDWQDLAGAQAGPSLTFPKLITYAMDRELREECGLTPGDLQQTYLVGYARMLHRAGKPEFFGITLLTEQAKLPSNAILIGQNRGCAQGENAIGIGSTADHLWKILSELEEHCSEARNGSEVSLILRLNLSFARAFVHNNRHLF